MRALLYNLVRLTFLLGRFFLKSLRQKALGIIPILVAYLKKSFSLVKIGRSFLFFWPANTFESLNGFWLKKVDRA